MYTSMGALSPAATRELQASLPRCYSLEFDRDCIEEAAPDKYPVCSQLLKAYEEDFDDAEKLVDAMPYCSERSARHSKFIWGAGGLLVGALIVAVVS